MAILVYSQKSHLAEMVAFITERRTVPVLGFRYSML